MMNTAVHSYTGDSELETYLFPGTSPQHMTLKGCDCGDHKASHLRASPSITESERVPFCFTMPLFLISLRWHYSFPWGPCFKVKCLWLCQ